MFPLPIEGTDKTSKIEVQNTELLTAGEAASQLKVHPDTVYEMIRSREIPFVKFGRTVRIRRMDLESFIMAHLEGSA